LSASGARPTAAALASLAGVGAFFFASYTFANAVTARRAHVPSIVFGWEHQIPFIAWTIIPYWTTDLFYSIGMFLCRTRAELRTYVTRLRLVQLICVAGFLLFPLRFSFERPAVTGFAGRLFSVLASFDGPYNQAPSLHVALTTILWTTYGKHFHGAVLWLIRLWFVMMALSTLTTYQHHFIDLPTGLAVGLLVLMSVPEDSRAVIFAPTLDDKRLRIGAIYLTAAVICAALAWRYGGAAWILVWPAEALAIVAAIYWIGRPDLFRKENGRVPREVVTLLGPYIAGTWLNARWRTRGRPYAEIADGVWVGRLPRRGRGFESIVDVTAELTARQIAKSIPYRSIPMLDLLVPSLGQIDAGVQAINEFRDRRPTLVCCAQGRSRSVTVIAAWLIASGKAQKVTEAVEFIRERRPDMYLRGGHRKRLEEWAARR